jgi:hypothetical protein
VLPLHEGAPDPATIDPLHATGEAGAESLHAAAGAASIETSCLCVRV